MNSSYGPKLRFNPFWFLRYASVFFGYKGLREWRLKQGDLISEFVDSSMFFENCWILQTRRGTVAVFGVTGEVTDFIWSRNFTWFGLSSPFWGERSVFSALKLKTSRMRFSLFDAEPWMAFVCNLHGSGLESSIFSACKSSNKMSYSLIPGCFAGPLLFILLALKQYWSRLLQVEFPLFSGS